MFKQAIPLQFYHFKRLSSTKFYLSILEYFVPFGADNKLHYNIKICPFAYLRDRILSIKIASCFGIPILHFTSLFNVFLFQGWVFNINKIASTNQLRFSWEELLTKSAAQFTYFTWLSWDLDVCVWKWGKLINLISWFEILWKRI